MVPGEKLRGNSAPQQRPIQAYLCCGVQFSLDSSPGTGLPASKLRLGREEELTRRAEQQ